MSTPMLENTSIDELKLRVRGGVHEPGDPQYEETCTLFNAMIERRPRLVVRCATPDDVSAALGYARGEGLAVTVRAGGHSVAGLSVRDDALVIDLREMSEIEVDPERRIARIGGGALWGDVDRATQRHGLATTGGRVSTTGVAGLTLGGGSGWLERKYGLASDNLVAAELVTADGRLVRASADENEDLFWALRGGGGNYGVVTTFEFRLHPVGPEVMGGLVLHPAERTAEVIALWRDVMTDAPDGLSLAFLAFTAPDEPDVPEELRNRNVAAIGGMYAGPVDEGEEALRAVRESGPPAADFFGPVPYDEFQCSLDDPPGYRNWWTAEYVPELPDEVIERIAARAIEKAEGPAQLFCAAWGGQVARAGSEAGPLEGRDARFVVHPLVLWEDPADDERMIAWGRGFREDVSDLCGRGTYLNFVGEEASSRTRDSYGDRNYERLARIKAAWDPEDVFVAGGHVPPASAEG